MASSQPSPSARACRSAGTPMSNVVGKPGVVLARDAVAVGGQPHHVEERLRRLARHVLIRRRGPARRDWPAGSRHRPRGRRRRSSPSSTPARAPRAGPRAPVLRQGRLGERRQQQHDAEIGVRRGPSGGRVDGVAHQRAERRARRRPRTARRWPRRWRRSRRSRRRRSRGPATRCPAWARGLEQARQLRRRSDVAGGPADRCRPRVMPGVRPPRPGRARATRAGDVIARCAPATSTPVARCSPSQPGMPLTSRT